MSSSLDLFEGCFRARQRNNIPQGPLFILGNNQSSSSSAAAAALMCSPNFENNLCRHINHNIRLVLMLWFVVREATQQLCWESWQRSVRGSNGALKISRKPCQWPRKSIYAESLRHHPEANFRWSGFDSEMTEAVCWQAGQRWLSVMI